MTPLVRLLCEIAARADQRIGDELVWPRLDNVGKLAALALQTNPSGLVRLSIQDIAKRGGTLGPRIFPNDEPGSQLRAIVGAARAALGVLGHRSNPLYPRARGHGFDALDAKIKDDAEAGEYARYDGMREHP